MNTAIAPRKIAEKPWTFALGVGIVRNASRIRMQRNKLINAPTYAYDTPYTQNMGGLSMEKLSHWQQKGRWIVGWWDANGRLWNGVK